MTQYLDMAVTAPTLFAGIPRKKLEYLNARLQHAYQRVCDEHRWSSGLRGDAACIMWEAAVELDTREGP